MQHRHRAFGFDGIVAAADGVLARHVLGIRDRIAQASADGFNVEVQQVAELPHQFRHAAGVVKMLHVMRARRF